jgi:hypothetical protein
MVKRERAERQLGHIMREGERIFDIIVLLQNRWNGLGRAEGSDCSDLDCRDSLLIFILKRFGGLDWRTDVNDGGWLLGDTGAGDKAIDDSLELCSSCLAKIHFYVPVDVIEFIVSVR